MIITNGDEKNIIYSWLKFRGLKQDAQIPGLFFDLDNDKKLYDTEAILYVMENDLESVDKCSS